MDCLGCGNHVETLYEEKWYEMTWGRLIARCLSCSSWYNPHAKALSEYNKSVTSGEDGGESVDKPSKPPDLQSSWAQFEHVALGRYITNGNSGNMWDARERAEPGETSFKTKLYPLWSTEHDLADWGVGVGLYFQNLRMFAIICFVAGLISIPNMIYYASDEYDAPFNATDFREVAHDTSQVCTRTRWVACPSCNLDDWDLGIKISGRSKDRYAVAKNDQDLKFLLKNDCEVGVREGIFMLIAMVFIAIAVFAVGYRQRSVEVEYDEEQQTASDYSIQIDNPPHDSHDHKEWKEFFEDNFVDNKDKNVHVTCITVAVNNNELINKLVKRRKLLLQIENLVEEGKKFNADDLEGAVAASLPVAGWKKLIFRAKDAQSIKENIEVITEEIKELQKKTYDVEKVFVTFEEEEMQRKVLKVLTVAKSKIFSNNIDAHSQHPQYLFRDKIVLGVQEPLEPSTIRWHNLNATILATVFQQLVTYLITFITIGISASSVHYCIVSNDEPLLATYIMTLMNQIVPPLIAFFMKFESHLTEDSFQASHYFKICLFRWVNTAIILTATTPLTETLQKGPYLVETVYKLYYAEMTLVPVLNYLDIVGTVKRHLLGPRARNQVDMDFYFKGSSFYLADLYTGMSKVVFLCFWYASIIPAVYFLTAATLMVHYISYKFAILRSYRAGPKLGAELAIFGRVYIFPLAVFFLFMQADYNWSSFPFDNVCETNSTKVTDSYIGSHNLQYEYRDKDGGETNFLDNIKYPVEISEGDSYYKFCNQDMYNHSPKVFPAFPFFQDDESRWMSDDQAVFSWVFSILVIVVLTLVVNSILVRRLGASILSYFKASYKPQAVTAKQRFSEQSEISAYVPMKCDPSFLFPLLLCDISDIDTELIGWEDARNKYDFHNLSIDVIDEMKEDNEDAKCYCILKHFPPKKND
eukprot:CAMPEP_0194364480 /NCGR_PEP_ID=MMETSP0174-20130528/12400_1 /TAXON_ID=216777 /ORGANISM="Proboscia alata, Strain PI-D3" /LENGTH=923 /DNA_ID=CAMNT_0039138535 /DNA_START=73 /DNA_END=2844 /DNA_ORIENTATION=+